MNGRPRSEETFRTTSPGPRTSSSVLGRHFSRHAASRHKVFPAFFLGRAWHAHHPALHTPIRLGHAPIRSGSIREIGPPDSARRVHSPRKNATDRAVPMESRAVPTENRAVPTENRAVPTESRAASTESRTVPTESRAVPTANRVVSTENRAVRGGTRAATTDHRALRPPTPYIRWTCSSSRISCTVMSLMMRLVRFWKLAASWIASLV